MIVHAKTSPFFAEVRRIMQSFAFDPTRSSVESYACPTGKVASNDTDAGDLKLKVTGDLYRLPRQCKFGDKLSVLVILSIRILY